MGWDVWGEPRPPLLQLLCFGGPSISAHGVGGPSPGGREVRASPWRNWTHVADGKVEVEADRTVQRAKTLPRERAGAGPGIVVGLEPLVGEAEEMQLWVQHRKRLPAPELSTEGEHVL